jgi:hypothetical protein
MCLLLSADTGTGPDMSTPLLDKSTDHLLTIRCQIFRPFALPNLQGYERTFSERAEPLQYWAVPRAPAEISCEVTLDLRLGRRFAPSNQQGVHRHDETRGAEPALRAMGACQALLRTV